MTEHLDAVVSVLAKAAEDGSPVAGTTPEDREHHAAIALRRVHSFGRRHGPEPATEADLIEDLAKGLRDRLEQEPRLVGPLMTDYRHVAALIVRALPPGE